MEEQFRYQTRWVLRKFADRLAFVQGMPYGLAVIDGNLMLNEGLTLLLNLLIGAAGTAYSNANARLGVGNGSAAESASQTGLQGATKTYKGMAVGYPQVSGQTVTFRATFTEAEANHAWEEFTVVNAADDAGTNLNRKVSSQGVKSSGQIWTLDLQITLS